jgi:hypothetical protein
MDSGKSYLTTTPGTQVWWSAQHRKRPCWQCRTWRRLARRVHWQCRKQPELVYLDTKPRQP